MLRSKSAASIRRTVLRTLTDACDIYDKTDADDGYGGTASTYESSSTNVPCRVTKPGKGEESVSMDALKGRMLFTFQFADDVEITTESRILYKGRYYEVLGVKAPVTDQFVTPVYCALIDA